MKRIKLPNLCLFWINKIDIEQNILLLSSSKNRFSACIHIRFFNKLKKHINLYENLYFGYQTLMKLKKLFGGGVIYFALFSTSKLFFLVTLVLKIFEIIGHILRKKSLLKKFAILWSKIFYSREISFVLNARNSKTRHRIRKLRPPLNSYRFSNKVCWI